MGSPLISVLVDTYNQERFIEECLVSVLEQDFPSADMEILAVDDGSTDHTPGIVHKFAPRVKYLRKPNGGQASAFNAGLAEARGELVAFLDGDDWWRKNKLAAVASAFARWPEAGVVGHGIIEVLRDGRRRTETIREECHFRADSPAGADMLRNRKHLLGSSRLTIRAAIARRIRPIPEIMLFEADEFLFTVAAVLSNVCIIPEPLTYYRHHESNLFQSGDSNHSARLAKLRILEALWSALKDRLAAERIDSRARNMIVEALQVEADQLRLSLFGGLPWKTISTELRILRIHHSEAKLRQKLFSLLRLLPATIIPAHWYYQCRVALARNSRYLRFRKRFLPIPMANQLRREEGEVKT